MIAFASIQNLGEIDTQTITDSLFGNKNQVLSLSYCRLTQNNHIITESTDISFLNMHIS